MNIKTVGDLADYLATQPRERLVVMSSDAEGNSHSPLADAEEAMYSAGCTWAGDIYPTPEEIEAPGSRYDPALDSAPEGAVRVVVLGPTN